MDKKILACNNDECIKKDECKRYKLYIDGTTEYSTNSGTAQKGCKKFIQK